VQRVGPCTLIKHNIVFVLAKLSTKPFKAATVARDVIYTARKDREDILSPFRSSAFEITDKKFRFPVN